MAESSETCLALEPDLSALIDGELSAERAAQLRGHLSSCPGCAARLAAFAALSDRLRSLEARPAPPALEGRLLARIAAERDAPAPLDDGARARLSLRGRSRVRRRRLAPGLAFLALAAAAAAIYLNVARAPLAPAPAPALAQQPRPSAATAPEPEAITLRERPKAAVEPPVPVEKTDAALETASEEELSVAIELDTLEDLEVIANLELLERIEAGQETDHG